MVQEMGSIIPIPALTGGSKIPIVGSIYALKGKLGPWFLENAV